MNAGSPHPAAHALMLVRAAVPRVHAAGLPVVAGAAGGTILLRAGLRAVGLRRASRLVGRLGAVATAASAMFFRIPRRVPPVDARAVVAPADGIIAQITTAAPPAETGLGDSPRTRVSIFLSLLDVHAQWVPVTGRVRSVHYHPGAFLSADLDKASEANERNSVVIRPADRASRHGAHAAGDGDHGESGGRSDTGSDTGSGSMTGDLVVTQIAGLLARRIVCDLTARDEVRCGDVYGLIRFGSRLDVYLPVGAEPEVRQGQRAVGAETVLARLPGNGP